MISIKLLDEEDIDVCYELDSNTISLWSKKQWVEEFKKKGNKVFGILLSNLVIGICVFHVVIDEAQINYFVINQKYRNKGFGTCLMSYLIKECKRLNIIKLILEVSHTNFTAHKFYRRFDFSTVGKRRNYYRDGSDALLKEKKLITK